MKQWRYLLLCLLCSILTACQTPSPTPTQAVPTSIQSQAVPTAVTSPSWATPTAALPTPTPFTTDPLPPTRPHNDSLAQWTILIYMAADNGRDPIALANINQMEAAGYAPDVNVLIQLDRATAPADTHWSDTRRYRLLGDADTNLISAEPLLTLGEQNMGDPAVLADFIHWGVQQYPANQYALLLWGDGAGWPGGLHDADSGSDLSDDWLSLPDITGALATALADAELAQLDLIAFDASLMGQLDVLQALRPYAHIALASQSLAPAAGWPYEAHLRTLYAQPHLSPSQLSQQWVTDFVGYYGQTNPNGRATLAAVDLSQLPAIATAVEQLAAVLAQNTAVHSGSVGFARAQAQPFALGLDGFAAVDLHHFASLLSQTSTDPAVIAAATAVSTAVEQAVLQAGHGPDIQHGWGINLYFPRLPAFYDPTYADLNQLPNWNSFLSSYYSDGIAQAPVPSLQLINKTNSTAGLQDPLLLQLQLASQQTTAVQWIAGLRHADGRRQLLSSQLLPATAVDGPPSGAWPAGWHELSFEWHTDANYLYDAQNNGDYALMWPIPLSQQLTAVHGQWQRADGSQTAPASALFDRATQQMVGLWQLSADGRVARPLFPQSGDSFQLNHYFYAEEGWQSEPGSTLYFDGNQQIYWRSAPLADGPGFFGVVAHNLAGQTAVQLLDFTIANADVQQAANLYIQPDLGFKFLYPEPWPAPLPNHDWQWSSHLTNTQLLISYYPNLEPQLTLAQFKQQTLQQFGQVDLLFESERLVAGRPSLLTAYGYNDESGDARSGLFLLFIDPQQNGFVLDIDGPQSDEAALLATLGLIADTWEFADTAVGLPSWQQAQDAPFQMAFPPDFSQQTVGDWYKFSRQPDTFMAWQLLPEPADSVALMAEWVQTIGQGLQTFNARPPYLLPLNGQAWARTDFSYDVADGVTIWGFVMVRVEAGQLLMAWAEAPGATYNELAPGPFMTMAADLRLKR